MYWFLFNIWLNIELRAFNQLNNQLLQQATSFKINIFMPICKNKELNALENKMRTDKQKQ